MFFKNINVRRCKAVGSSFLLCFLLRSQPVTGQDVDPAAASNNFQALAMPDKAEIALKRIQNNDVGLGIVDATYYIEIAAHAGPSRAIPVLESYFARTREPEFRSEIASVLVSLGDQEPTYWDLLLDQARAALASDSPDPMDPAGPEGPCSSSAFKSWAMTRNSAPEEACKEATLGIADKLRPLAETGDPRVQTVLREALKAQNSVIRMIAIHGLVLARDKDSIPLIIEALHRVNGLQAREMADSLIESDDPRAEQVVRQYIPDVNIVEARQFRTENSQWKRPLLTRR